MGLEIPKSLRSVSGTAAAGALALALIAAGCAARHDNRATAAVPAAAASAAAPQNQAQAAVNINYAKKDDSLLSLSVTKYNGAQIIATRPAGANTESVVRFDGGVPVWEVRADRGLLGHVPGFAGRRIAKVRYGVIPEGFEEVVPDSGPPEPLEAGAYYVFTVTRASGATDFDVVKILSDGSLAVYTAQPRAGTSYLLCCNVGSDFAENPPPLVPADTPPIPPPDDSQ
jgi:hypothetical protein